MNELPSVLESFEMLAERVLPESLIESTDDKLRATNVAFSGSEFAGVSLLAGIIAAIGLYVASIFVPFPLLPGFVYSIIAFVGTFLVLVLVLPFFFIESRVGDLEESLPDALRQMATALRAGVSMSEAMDDVAKSDYGSLSEEFERTITQVRRGRPMGDALRGLANRSNSELFERAFFLVVEGMERGAELADVLEAVSDDIRETHSIQRERKATTMQQVMFLLAAALFAAPFITGLVLSLESVFAEVGAAGGGGSGSTTLSGPILPPGTKIIVPAFLAIESSITALAVGVIRYGKVSKGAMFVAPFIAAALGVFYAAQVASGFMF